MATTTVTDQVTEGAIREILEGITDPCSVAAGAPVGLVSMGLLLNVSITGPPEAAVVRVELGITEPGCLMAGIFSTTAEREIRALPHVAEVEVRVDHGHLWDPNDMAASYRARLAEVRADRHRRAAQGGAA